jgi:hypothetical protein
MATESTEDTEIICEYSVFPVDSVAIYHDFHLSKRHSAKGVNTGSVLR